MARGDFTIFNKAKEWEGDGTIDYDTNTFKIAICDNTTTPAATDATPTLINYTQVGTAGSYTDGGLTVTMTWVESSGTVTLDSDNPTFTADVSNDSDAYWGILYQYGLHNTVTNACVGFLDLGGPIDMSVDPITVSVPSGWFTKA